MHFLHDTTFERWRELITHHILMNVWPGAGSQDNSELRPVEHPKRPSAALVQALLSLASSLQDFWATIDSERKQLLVGSCVTYFVSRGCKREVVKSQEPHRQLQFFWDLWFLQHLTTAWDDLDVRAQLDDLIADVQEKLLSMGIQRSQLEGDDSISEYLSRMQIILSPLFPPPGVHFTTHSAKGKSNISSALLCYAPPTVEQQFQPALELVKPSARFGLLLVGNSTTR